MLLCNIGDMCISTKKHRVIGYANVNTRQLIIHLYAKYANVTAVDLKENKHRMKTAYNPNQPIKKLYI